MKIWILKKIENAPYVPHAKPIEQFWTLCNKEYAKRKETAKKHHILKKDVVKISKKVEETSSKAPPQALCYF
jgi:hypothetical protein